MHKKIMTVSRGSLLGDKVERLSVGSTTYKLNKARIRQKHSRGLNTIAVVQHGEMTMNMLI